MSRPFLTLPADSALAAWVNARDPFPEKAESILKQMLDLYESGTFDTLKPEARQLTQVIQCYVHQSKHTGGGTHKTESVLRRYESIADELNFNTGA